MIGRLAVVLAFVLCTAPGRSSLADDRDLSPRGSLAEADGSIRSSKSFRDTVRHVERALARRGTTCEVIGPYRRRGVTVVRFVATDPASHLEAVHVWQRGGKAFVAWVARPSPTAPASPTEGNP